MKNLFKKVLILLPALTLMACGTSNDNDANDPWGEDDDNGIVDSSSTTTTPEAGGDNDKTPDAGGDEGGNQPGGNEGDGNEGGNQPGGNEGGGDQPGGNEGGGNQPGGGTEGGDSEGDDTTKEHVTYICLGENGRYNNAAGTSIKINDTLTLQYAFKLTLDAGAALPGADKITSTLENTTFKHFYAGEAIDTAITTVPTQSGTILTAAWNTVVPPTEEVIYAIEGTGFEKINLKAMDKDPNDENMTAQFTGKANLKVGDTLKVSKSGVETFAWSLDTNNTKSGDFTFADNIATVKRADEYTFYFKLYKDGGNTLTAIPSNPKQPEEAKNYLKVYYNGQEEPKTVPLTIRNETNKEYSIDLDLRNVSKFEIVKETQVAHTLEAFKDAFSIKDNVVTVLQDKGGFYSFWIKDDGKIYAGEDNVTVITRGEEEILVDFVKNGEKNEFKGVLELKANDLLRFYNGSRINYDVKNNDNFVKNDEAKNCKVIADGIYEFFSLGDKNEVYPVKKSDLLADATYKVMNGETALTSLTATNVDNYDMYRQYKGQFTVEAEITISFVRNDAALEINKIEAKEGVTINQEAKTCKVNAGTYTVYLKVYVGGTIDIYVG